MRGPYTERTVETRYALIEVAVALPDWVVTREEVEAYLLEWVYRANERRGAEIVSWAT